MPDDYAIDETRITIAGVLRCCLQDVAMEYKDRRVKIGDTSRCPHCKQAFTLTINNDLKRPTWIPDWQKKSP